MNRTIGNKRVNIGTNYNKITDIVSVVVVDDNEKLLDNICDTLTKDQSIKIVGKAKNGEEGFDVIKKTAPDVVILDLIMPKMDGLSLMDKVHKEECLLEHRFLLLHQLLAMKV